MATGGLGPRALRRLRRAHLGYVYQRPSHNLIPRLSATEHLQHALAVRRPARAHREGEGGAAESPSVLLDLVGLRHRAAHRPAELSGG